VPGGDGGRRLAILGVERISAAVGFDGWDGVL